MDVGELINAGLKHGVQSFQMENYQSSIYHFQMVLNLDSQNFSAIFHLGRIYFHQDNHVMAKKYFSQAIQMNSAFVNAWFQHDDKCIDELQNNNEELCQIEPMTKNEQEQGIAHYISEIFYELRDNEEYKHCFDESISIEKNNDSQETDSKIDRKNCDLTSH